MSGALTPVGVQVEDAVIYPAAMFTGSQLQNGFPGRAIPHLTAIAGGSAGDHTVLGVASADDLAGVLRLNRDGTASNIDVTDLTSEFSISAADTINNAGGTDTTGDTLIVSWSSSPGTQQAGIPYSATVQQKATAPVFVPKSWPSVDISVVALAGQFGSGGVRLGQGGSPGDDAVTVTVAASYVGVLSFPTGPTWSAGFGPVADYQFTQFSLSRLPDHGDDTLAEPFCVLAVVFTNGG